MDARSNTILVTIQYQLQGFIQYKTDNTTAPIYSGTEAISSSIAVSDPNVEF